MENATKALLIAAGIFLVILIVSTLTVFYNDISTYYSQEHELALIEQAQKFNAKFENYHRNNIRGSDLISLMNKVIDYNTTESYFVGTGYERINVTITLGGDAILNQFKYEPTNSTSTNQYLQQTKISGNWVITNTTGTGVLWEDDNQLIAITNTPSDLSDDLLSYRVPYISDAQLQQLIIGIANIMADEDEDSTGAAYNRLKRAELLEDVLGITGLSIDSTTGKSNNHTYTKNVIKQVKNIVSQYFQYMQFKRAYFDCTEINYDPETNRVVGMNFELQIKNGNVVFN